MIQLQLWSKKMNIRDVIIPPNVLDKIEAEHNVNDFEVDEVLFNAPQFHRLEKGNVDGEDLYVAFGQTEAGRYLKVLFIHKRNKDALVITAFDMSRKERRRYVRT